MKKNRIILMLIFIFSMFLFVVGCNVNSNDNKEDKKEEKQDDDKHEEEKEDDEKKEEEKKDEPVLDNLYIDEYGYSRSSNVTCYESIILNEANYNLYKNELIGDGGESGLLNKGLVELNKKDINKDETNYLVYVYYKEWKNENVNYGNLYFSTAFSTSLIKNDDSVLFDNEAIEYKNITKKNYELKEANAGLLPANSKANVRFNLNNNYDNRLQISAESSYLDLKHYTMFSIAISFSIKDEGKFNVNFSCDDVKSNSDLTKLELNVGEIHNNEEIVRINDYKVSFIPVSLCPNGEIDDSKLSYDLSFVKNAEVYIVIDFNSSVIKDNDGMKKIYSYLNVSNIEKLDFDIEDVSSSNFTTTINNNSKNIKIEFSVSDRAGIDKNYRLIFKIKPTSINASSSIDVAISGCNINRAESFAVKAENNYIYDSFDTIIELKDKNIIDAFIPSGSSVGKEVFSNCKNLTQVEFEDKVVSIGEYAFKNCTNLNNVIFPDSYIEIASTAFEGCDSSLFTEENGLVYIGYEFNKYLYLLKYTQYLETYNININSKYMANGIFEGNEALKNIAVYTKNIPGNTFKNCTNLQSVSLGNAESVGDNAFENCNSLDTILYGDRIKVISNSAFKDCHSLNNLAFSNNATTIGDNAFENCYALKAIIVPSTVKSIGNSAFKNCNSLEEIALPFINKFSDLFGTSSNQIPLTLKKITIDGNTKIPKEAFKDCYNLTEIIISKNVKEIGYAAFSGCSSLQKLTLPFASNRPMSGTSSRSLSYPDDLFPIGYLFGKDSYNNGKIIKQYYKDRGSQEYGNYCIPLSLTEITIDGVTEIQYGAFYDMDMLKKITISNDVTNITSCAFYGCKSLEEIILPFVGEREVDSDYTYFTNLFGYVFGGCDLNIEQRYDVNTYDTRTNSIPSSLKKVTINNQYIPYGAFYNCKNIKSITLGDRFDSFGTNAFYGLNSLEELVIDENNSKYDSRDNCNAIIETETNTLVFGTKNSIIVDSITSIGDYAFANNEIKDSIKLGKNIESIGANAFKDTYITDIEFNDKITTIGDSAFRGCNLHNVILPDSLTNIGASIFAENYVSSLSLQYIGESPDDTKHSIRYFFGGIPSSLKKVTFTGNVLPESAFEDCENLEIINFTNEITKVNSNAFKGCKSLKYVNIESLSEWLDITFANSYANPTYYSHELYINDEAITDLIIPDDVNIITAYSFVNCENITSIILHSNVNGIGTSAFSGCYRLIKVVNKSNINIELNDYNNGYISNYAKLVTNDEARGVIRKTDDGFTIFECNDLVHVINYLGNNTNITIPNNVKSIGYGAFMDKTNLENINIPNSVEVVDGKAFANCTSLTNIIIPNSVTRIDDEAFSGCSNLTNLVLSNNLNQLGKDIVKDCKSLIYNVSDNLNYIKSSDNDYYILVSLASKDITKATVNDNCKIILNNSFTESDTLNEIIIPNSVEYISKGAISYCRALKSLTLPFIGERRYEMNDSNQYPLGYIFGNNSCTQHYIGENGELTSGYFGYQAIKNLTITDSDYIQYGALSNFSNLESIILCDSVKSIESRAFYSCSNLETITLGNSLEAIKNDAFYNCKSLAKVNIKDIINWCNIEFEDSLANPVCAAHNLYLNDELITNLVIPNEIENIKRVTFINATALETVTLPNGIKTIGSGAFYGCTSLTSINLPNTITSIERNAFCNCELLGSIDIPESLTSIGSQAFSGCKSFDKLLIPNTVTSIASDAFKGCYGVTTLTGPSSVLGDRSFSFVEEVVITSGDTIPSNAFYQCTKLVSVKLPNTITTIGSNAFAFCELLSDIDLPESIVSIGKEAFYGCTALTHVEFSNNLTALADGAFKNSGLTNVSIPDSLKSVGNDIFYGCKISKATLPVTAISGLSKDYLTEVVLNDCEEIPANTFANCYYLSSITLPENLKTIGNRAFSNCQLIENITIPNTVTYIGTSAFEGCELLTNIIIPDNVTYIGGSVFAKCKNLTSITIPFVGEKQYTGQETYRYPLGYLFGTTYYTGSVLTGQHYIGKTVTTAVSQTYYLPSVLNEIIVTKGTYIPTFAFENCYKLTNISLPDTIKTISSAAFEGCTGLTELSLPDDLEMIDGSAFENCSNITKLVINDKLNKVALGAFNYCNSLNGIYVSDLDIWCNIDFSNGSETTNPLYYAKNLYVDNNLLTDATIKAKVSDYAFVNCSSLTNVTLAEGIESIGYRAFGNCINLENINLPNTLTSIDGYAFSGCSKLNSLNMSDGLLSIGEKAFLCCSLIENIIVPSTVTSIGFGAFSGCTSLESITLPFAGEKQYVSTAVYQYPFGYIFGNGNYEGCIKVSQSYKSNSGVNSTDYYIPLSLKEVIITNGTYLQYGAFMNCTYLEKITLSDDLTNIPDYAFSGCTSINNIIIPDGVNEIGISSFSNCTSFTEIAIPSGVTSIGKNAFNGCTSLTKIIIPDTVTTIADGAFKDCNLLTSAGLIGSEANYQFGWTTDIPANAFSGLNYLTNITLPENVENIGANAFSGCTLLTSLTLPNKLTSIGEGTFSGFTSLKNITFGDDLTEIGKNAFNGCTSLTEVVLPLGLTTIGERAFNGCTSLEKLVINENVSSIGYNAFNGCTKLITAGAIGSESNYQFAWDEEIPTNAFCNCSNITSIDLPNTIISVGENAFYGCKALKDITIPSNLENIGKMAFYYCSIETVVFPDTLKSIGNSAFGQCSFVNITMPTLVIPYLASQSTKTITITSGTSIKENAFYGYYRLSSVTLPDTITSIGKKAFYNCSALTSIVIPNGVTGLASSTFEGCTSLETISMPKVTSIADSAFRGCSSLNNIDFSNNTYSIGEYAFINCTSLKSIEIESSYSITIGKSAFSGCTSLTNVELPKSIYSIGETAFKNCPIVSVKGSANVLPFVANSNLVNVEITGGTSIANNALQGCSAITTLKIAESIESIGDYAFAGCILLTNVKLPDSIKYIGRSAFYACEALNYYEYDNGYYLGNENNNYLALIKAKSTDITSCIINDNCKVISNAFEGCTLVNNVAIPSNVISISDYAFAKCSSLTNLSLPNSITSISNNMFLNCTSLVNITIPDGITSIGNYSFSGCTSLESVNIPNSVITIGEYAFNGCTSLESIILPNSITTIGGYAFAGSGLKNVILPNNITEIIYCIFQNCSSIESVIIPKGITKIGNYAFDGCTSFKNVYYKGSEADWKAISYIGINNGYLNGATFTYNYNFE